MCHAILLSPEGSQCGNFKGEILHSSEVSEGDLFWEMDGFSQQLHDCYCALFGPGKELEDETVLTVSNFLHLDRIEIDPLHRGQELGNISLASILAFFSKTCGMAGMKPFPLQWEGKLSNDEGTGKDDERFRADLKKLHKYYKPLGFRRPKGGGQWLIRELSDSESIAGRQRGDWKRCPSFKIPER